MQEWNWRQKFVQSLSNLSHQNTQAMLTVDREQRHLEAVSATLAEVEAKMAYKSPELDLLKEPLVEAGQTFEGVSKFLLEYEDTLQTLWKHPSPSADLDALIQEHARKKQNTLEVIASTSAKVDVHHQALRQMLT
jgi:hypothetical protein